MKEEFVPREANARSKSFVSSFPLQEEEEENKQLLV